MRIWMEVSSLLFLEVGKCSCSLIFCFHPFPVFLVDCVECMACSDNVVRAGLTPKFKDVETLCSMLTYEHGPIDRKVMKGDQCDKDPNTRLYDPPIEEFTIAYTRLSSDSKASLFAVDGPSIVIVVQGKGKLTSEGELDIHKGSCLFIPAGVASEVVADEGELLLYRAFCVRE